MLEYMYKFAACFCDEWFCKFVDTTITANISPLPHCAHGVKMELLVYVACIVDGKALLI